MPPKKRMLHSKIWVSDQFTKLSFGERLLFIGMITLGDDEGLFLCSGRYLKAQIFPYDKKISPSMVEKMRDQIAEVGLIKLDKYEDKLIGCHPKWNKYQTLRKDRRQLSEFSNSLVDVLFVSGDQLTTQQNQTQHQQKTTKENENTTEKNSTSTDEIKKIFSEKPESFRDVVNKEIKKTGTDWQIQP